MNHNSKISRLHELFYVWTSSYHHHSFIYTPFYKFEKYTRKEKKIPSKIRFNGRKKSAIALVSKCDKFNYDRIKYIEDLSKYFPVEMYGNCFGKRISSEEQIILYRTRMFSLSFENSVCYDYSTEKYSNPILYRSIPVVINPDWNRHLLIPGSFINAIDFKSPKELGEYLHFVSENYFEYAKYLDWNNHYKMTQSRIMWDVCHIQKSILDSKSNGLLNDPTYFNLLVLSMCSSFNKTQSLLYRDNS